LTFGSPMLASGCGSSGSGATTSKGDAGAGDAGSGTVSVLVLDQEGFGANPYSIVAGATVAIDKPGGTHEEATSDANGMVTFSGIDWSLGNAAFLVTKDGTAAYGVSDVNPGNFKSIPIVGAYAGQPADVYLFSQNPSSKGPVTLTTTFQNKAAATNYVYVGATTGNSTDVNTPSADLAIGNTSPYSLITHEFTANATAARQLNLSTVRWTRFDEPQPTGTTAAVTLDLAAGGTKLTQATASVHVVIPGGQTGPLAGCTFYSDVTSTDSFLTGFFGENVQSTLGADQASFTTLVESVSVPGQNLITVYECGVGSAYAPSSYVDVPGPPVSGASIENLILPISVKSASISLSQPIDVSTADPTTLTRLYVPDASGNTLVFVDAPPGTAMMHLPTLPASLKTSLQTAGKAGLSSYFSGDATLSYYSRGATSAPFAVTP
jgi:hypothetical protein